jgi:signal transduction histidine kinase
MSVKIIEEHGGRIDISSTPGIGTTVSIFLPILRED